MAMPPHLHRLLSLNKSDTVKVQLNGHAHVMLMDERNYAHYNDGGDFDFFGKLVKQSPCLIAVPATGEWHLVIEQEDPRKDVTAHIQVISLGSPNK